MKIQQMAFMLVGLMVFFGLIALIYFSITLSNLKKTATALQEEEAAEIVATLAGAPELAFTSSSDCNSCVDTDKALILKEINSYENFWNLDYLMIEKIYPENSGDECTRFNYPDCGKITLISKTTDFGLAKPAIVSLARYDDSTGRFKYELGKIYASGKNPK